MAMKKCFSMECLSSSTSSSAMAPAYYAAAAALAATNSNSPSASSSSSLVSVEEAGTPEKMANGYLSDGLMGRAQERKKGEFHGPEFHSPVFLVVQLRAWHEFFLQIQIVVSFKKKKLIQIVV
jgi:hypothetical protein